jgi:hypothetical protein
MKFSFIILLFCFSVLAEQPSALRIRLQYTEDSLTRTYKQTLGLGPEICQWTEIFRAYEYHIENKLTGEVDGYTSLGFKTPKTTIMDGITSQTTIFGQTGSVQGGGLQSVFTAGNITDTINIETTRLVNNLVCRIGSGFDYKLDKLILGMAYDITTSKNYITPRAIYDITNKDVIGVAYQNTKNRYGTSACYTHYGEKEPWGIRILVSDDHTTGQDNYFGYIVVAEHPTLIKDDAVWWVGRNVGDKLDTGYGNSAVLEQEPYTTAEMANKGAALIIKMNNTQPSNQSSFYVSPAYTWDIGVFKPSVLSFFNTTFSKTNCGGGIELRIKDIFKIEVNHMFNEKTNYIGVQFGARW